MSSIRRVLIVMVGVGLLASLATLHVQWAHGQKVILQPGIAIARPIPASPDPSNPKEFSHAITLPTDSKLKKKIEAAEDFIREQDWENASRMLQLLLDAEQDFFIEVTRKGVDGKETLNWISARKEAERLLGTFPPKGMEHYQLKAGPTAQGMLDEAKKTSDAGQLAQVAQRFLYTDAGAEATNLLGTYHLDRSRYVVAALCFERLLQREGFEKVAPATLFKAALAFRRAGDTAGEANVWKHLTARAGGGVKLGTQMVALPDLQKILASNSPVARLSEYDWTMYRGNSSRSAQGNGGSPFMDARWTQPTIVSGLRTAAPEAKSYVLDQAVKQLNDREQPILPSFFPVAATIRKEVKGKEETVPLLVYRSYWGIHAVNLKTGKLDWDMPSAWSLQGMLGNPQTMPAVQQWITQYVNISKQSILFDNSTLGTLSTDNTYLYAVDDLAVPPFSMNPYYGNGQQQFYANGAVNDAIYHSKLLAIELRTGKLAWQIGGRGEKGGELNDSYFLGPPLPLGGKIYVLTEKNQELRLVCLDPSKLDSKENPDKENAVKNAINWVQTLATTQNKLLQDVGRRMQAAHLTYGEGILVCPTNAGAVLGIDLLSHSLVWAHAYRKIPTETVGDPEMMMWRGGRVTRSGVTATAGNNDWRVSAPVIQDGKVIFTAPDALSVHCLNLRDGSLLWEANKGDEDLYLGGVFNGKVLIVGKKTCRALNLADGKQSWVLETGMPSGQGIASDNVYYLPLRKAAKSKEPEVCAIDIDKGVAIAHTKSRKKDVPGNLLFYEGDVLSQTVSEVAAYPQLKVKLQQSDELIARNPKDPVGLTARGELKLDKGDLQGAVDDLRLALVNDPPRDVVPLTRLKLYETITDLLQRDFNSAERYLPEYKDLCRVEITADMRDKEKQEAEEEQQRRQANFLCLLAKGREQQGRLGDAFDAYEQFAAFAAKQELISVIDEPSVKAPPREWSMGRIAAMVARCTPEQRKPLEEKIARRWLEVKDGGDLGALRHFVAMFGSYFKAGREARAHLSERLMEETGASGFLEAEQQLHLLRDQIEDPQMAGRAVEGLARLMTRKGLLEDAAYFYRVLGRDFTKVIVREGKTGDDFFNELATDKRFLPYLDEPGISWAGRKIEVRTERTANQMTQQIFAFEPEGEVLPFFLRHKLALNLGYHKFQISDRATGEVRWELALDRTNFQQFVYANGNNIAPRFPYHLAGHVVVLQLGHMVFGLDPVNHQKLWAQNLVGQPGIPQHVQVNPDPRDGSLQVVYPDGWYHRLGQTGPIEASYLCLQTREGLIALDPVTGRTLWTRSDVSNRSQIFGDAQHVYVVEMGQDGNPASSLALRAHDGVRVSVPDFTALYQRRIRIRGGNLLVADNSKTGQTLRLYDVQTGQDVWKQSFAANSVPLRSEEPNLAGVVEPNGKITVIDLTTQREVLKSALSDPKHLEKAQAVYLLQDRSNYYLAINGPADPQNNPWGGPWPNLVPGSGMRAIPVNGEVYAFDRSTGKLRYHDPVLQQSLVLEQFQDLPFLLFTSRYQKLIANGANRFQTQGASVKSIDKNTGKLLFDQPEMVNGPQFYALNVDLRAGRIDFIGYNMKISHILVADGAKGADAGTKDTGSATSSIDSSLPPQGGIRLPVPLIVPALPEGKR